MSLPSPANLQHKHALTQKQRASHDPLNSPVPGSRSIHLGPPSNQACLACRVRVFQGPGPQQAATNKTQNCETDRSRIWLAAGIPRAAEGGGAARPAAGEAWGFRLGTAAVAEGRQRRGSWAKGKNRNKSSTERRAISIGWPRQGHVVQPVAWALTWMLGALV
jgi:hypothetical protein